MGWHQAGISSTGGSILAVGDDCFTPEVIKMWFIRNLKLILLEGDEN